MGRYTQSHASSLNKNKMFFLQQFFSFFKFKELYKAFIIEKRDIKKSLFISTTIVTLLFSLVTSNVIAQLDNKHWLPPLTGVTFSIQNIVLSTSENTAFLVEITTPDGAVVGTLMISSSSYTYDSGDNDNNITLMSHTNVGVALTTGTSGLIFEFPGGQDFYVNYRVNTSLDQAALLTNNKEKKVSPLRDYPYPKEEGIPENLSDHTVGTDCNDFIPVTFKNLKDFNYAV